MLDTHQTHALLCITMSYAKGKWRREAFGFKHEAGCARGDIAGYTLMHGTLTEIPFFTCCCVLRMMFVAIKLI